ncbi:TPA: hypothetical protein DCR49_11390 [Candidatus Delongbacteria bacterium]|nr:hypothetical protein [Candidatus Delongbacteria bacterium]
MKKLSLILMLAAMTAVYFAGCSDDDKDKPSAPVPDTILKVIVKGKVNMDTVPDTIDVSNSNVVVYDAETNQSVIRDMTNSEGACYFELEEGNYYLEVTAQGFDPSPAPNVTAIPFFVTYQDTTAQVRYLNENPLAGAGYIEGKVEPAVNNVLIIAENAADFNRYSGVSGPDGYFVVFNLPLGSYNIEAFKAGYKQSAAVSSTLYAGAPQDSVAVLVETYAGSSISGSTSFIAGAVAKPTDIVLRDIKTLDAIPGLTVSTDSSNNYTIDNIPDGDFIIWASLKNDDNVIDPDWLFKNPGALELTFPTDSGTVLGFTLTGAIVQNSPTNPADSIYAFMADSIVPTFVWTKISSYSSTKQWILEVRDINGRRIWGGFEPDGTINHAFIGAAETSVEFNFDGSALSELVPGEIYQWSIWADDDTAPGIQTLLSSSEDLRGLFQVPEPIPVK